MTQQQRTPKAALREKYEAPQAIRLTDDDRAYGSCTPGSAFACVTGTDGAPVGYRVREFDGVCVTGKAASEGCYAGVW